MLLLRAKCKSQKMFVSSYLWVRVCYSLSHVLLFATPWTVSHQAPLSMKFSRKEYWSELPFPSPGDLPDPGIKLWSPALQADSLLSVFRGGAERGRVKIYICVYIFNLWEWVKIKYIYVHTLKHICNYIWKYFLNSEIYLKAGNLPN